MIWASVLLWQSEMSYVRRLSGPGIKRYFAMKEAFATKINKLLGEKYVLVIPAWPTVAPYNHQLKFNRLNIIQTAVSNALGLPSITCPVYLSSESIPINVQIIAARDNDRILFSVAEMSERKIGGWTAPVNN
uniref:Amidase domain-containing protein n=1 Tax=Rhabditophanes sp. KR3021 TaxID=114890 RepID=A0AC35THT1_9BILA